MTDTPMAVEINCETGEVVERPLTAEEIAANETAAAQAEADRLIQEAQAQALADLKASAKAKLIAGQPLTAEEADTLVL
jgi:regulator of protease activity HflC (stomatin/prohibitin superfamily)